MSELERVRAGETSNATRILVVAESPIRERLCQQLVSVGRVETAVACSGRLECLKVRGFDLLILDVDAPGSGGVETIRTIRERSPVPIVVLSVYGDEELIVRALGSGADDYLRKPIGTQELLARVTNAMRRRAQEEGKQAHIISGELEIDLINRRIYRSGIEVHLSVRQFAVLRVLAQCPGRVLAHDAILREIWGPECSDRVEYLRLAVRELRLKLESNPASPRHILTERGVGYRLQVSAVRATNDLA